MVVDMKENAGLNVQHGAGWSAADGWLNYDASPSVWLERTPVIGRFIRVNEQRFPEGIIFGDILAGLPLAAIAAKSVYASHVLEHLSYEDCVEALHNTFKLLRPGGIFRLVVPDLERCAEIYLESVRSGDDASSDKFCRSTLLGRERRPKTLKERVRTMFGNSEHLWMWDFNSMSRALSEVGFVDIRRCQIGDSSDPSFINVEAHDLFFDTNLNTPELAIEARRSSEL